MYLKKNIFLYIEPEGVWLFTSKRRKKNYQFYI